MTNANKTKLCFLSAGASVLLAVYCFAGAVMNGSFAIAGPIDVGRYHRNAAILFWISMAFACVALACLTWGLVRHWRQSKHAETMLPGKPLKTDGRASW